MAGMNTTYNDGGVQTTTEAGGLPALPGTGGTDMMSFFRAMARRQDQVAMNRKNEERADAFAAQRRQDQAASRVQPQQRTTWVKNIHGGPGLGHGGLVQAHAGEPGAVMGGFASGPEPVVSGGGSFSAAGGQDDLLRAQRNALDWQRYKNETADRGFMNTGDSMVKPAGG